jgi:hypothetical protein
MAKVTKDMLIGEILRLNGETAQFFFEMECTASDVRPRGESLEDACLVHGSTRTR